MKVLIAGDAVPNTDFAFSDDFIDLCSKHALRICNLEGALSQQQQQIHKAGPCILLNDNYLSKLATYFNLVTLANNHSMDYKYEGLQYTIQQCAKYGMMCCGAGKNIIKAIFPQRHNNISVISVAENEFGAAQYNRGGIATTEYEKEIYQAIRLEKKEGQNVIMIVHGGSEIIPIPPPYFRNRLQLYSLYGADLVIGNHPHVPQGAERPLKHQVHNWKLCSNIYYSLGNFLFLSADFSNYFNHDWSVVVSYDTESNLTRPYFTTIKNGVITLIDKEKEFDFLCELLESDDYEQLYTQVSHLLYPDWYGELNTNAHAYLLHHIRCDAHRNIVQRALASKIGEYDGSTRNFQAYRQNGDSVFVKEI
jgi:poly-gamma-glutamate synthesis protein (capsule biosynthesis protein)